MKAKIIRTSIDQVWIKMTICLECILIVPFLNAKEIDSSQDKMKPKCYFKIAIFRVAIDTLTRE